MPTATLEIDKLKIPLKDGKFTIIAFVKNMVGEFEWNNGAWEVYNLYLPVFDSDELINIEGNPDFRAFEDAAVIYANETLGIPTSSRNTISNEQYRTHGGNI